MIPLFRYRQWYLPLTAAQSGCADDTYEWSEPLNVGILTVNKQTIRLEVTNARGRNGICFAIVSR